MIVANFELVQGEMVGEYRVDRKIGEGAFGKVYAAVHPVIGKPAAIKVLNPALSTNQEMVTRFVAEARAVNQIRHRNIIDIFSFGTLPNGVSYFVMELLEGMTLQQYLRQNGPLDPALALSILWPVGKALSAAHKAGIAHRDLKPENVFLVIDQDGGMFPKLLDFGIAKLMSESEIAHRTQTGMLLGTPVYMSPEQCRATQVDHRADIYAFGIMTHEALAGRRPFEAENLMDVIMQQLTAPAPRLSASRPGLPSAFDAPVLHMLEKQAGDRPQTMQAALDELAEAARVSGIQSPVSLPQSSGGTPMSAQVSAPGGPSSLSRPGSSPSLDTNAWLQHQAGVGGMAGSGSMAGPGGSMAGPPGSMAVPSGAHSPSGSYAGPGAHSPSGSYAGPASQVPQGSYPAAGMAPGGQGSYPAAGMAPGGQGSYPTAGLAPGGVYPGFPPPQGDTATLQSAGMAPGGSSPSLPGSGPSASMSGFAPASVAQPAPTQAKSKLPLFIGGGVLAVALVAGGAFALSGGGKGPAGSGSATASGTGSMAAPNTVQIGAAPPRVGRNFDQETDVSFQLEVWMPSAKKAFMSLTQKQFRKFKINVLAVNEWSATRLEVQYADSFETTKQEPAAEKKKPSPTANRGFFVAAQDSGPSVSAVDGKPITDVEKKAVISDVSDMLRPRPDVFRRPLAVGESLSPPTSVASAILGVTEDDDGTETRAENAVFKLTSIDRASQRAEFDVQFTFVYSVKASKIDFNAPMKGTMSFDIPTGIPVAGKLTGPIAGTLVDSGIKAEIKGALSMEVKASVTP